MTEWTDRQTDRQTWMNALLPRLTSVGVITVCHDSNRHQQSMERILEVNAHLVDDPTTVVSPDRFKTGQGHCRACRKTWSLTDVCSCGETQTMSHIVKSCQAEHGLSQLHSADNAATPRPGVGFNSIHKVTKWPVADTYQIQRGSVDVCAETVTAPRQNTAHSHQQSVVVAALDQTPPVTSLSLQTPGTVQELQLFYCAQ